MKAVAALSCLALANAFILPDPKIFEQAALRDSDRADKDASWWDRVPSKDSIVNTVENGIDSVATHVDDAFHFLKETAEDKFDHFYEDSVFGEPEPHGTLYDIVSKSKYTRAFFKLVEPYDDLVKVLKCTKSKHTLFVPTNAAIDRIPKGHKPSKEFLELILKYHIGVGEYDAKRVLRTHTLPTLYHEKWLGGKPQRLRTSVGLGGVRVNFYAKVVAVNIRATNGIIHAVDHVIIPPPMIGREFSLLPSTFSTLLLAYGKTDFIKYVEGITANATGNTIFAPSNRAWARLGIRANAFLFDSRIGQKYLKALLKYQIVTNATLYSDAFYRPDHHHHKDVKVTGHYHLDLPTLLCGKSIAVDVATGWGGWTSVKLNGYIPIVVADGVAKNGVIHVPARVPIPPHKHRSDYDGGEIEVEDLKERLAEFVDEKEDKEDDWVDGEL